jgi:microcystin-dependent protein
MKRIKQTLLDLVVLSQVSLAFAADPPHLIPFQGHLARPTAADANQFEPVPAGRYDILFTLYAAPVGGESKVWGPERHSQLTVINGLVNAMLGSVIGFGDAVAANPNFFARPLYVGITVDADGNPNTADLELVPRQALLPAVYALGAMRADRLDNSDWRDFFVGTDAAGTFTPGTTKARDAEKLHGFDWSHVFGGNGYPTNTILANRIADSSITGSKIAAQTIPAGALVPASITSQQIAPGTITAANLHSSLTINSIIPPGTISAFAGPEGKVPAGWLLCNGAFVRTNEYPSLYAAIGTTWGAGSAANDDFTLPDLRGRLPLGAGQGPSLAFRPLADLGGEENHTLTKDEMPVHNHTWTKGFSSDDSGTGGGAKEFTDVDGSHATVIGNAGSGWAHNTMPPFRGVNYIIKY